MSAVDGVERLHSRLPPVDFGCIFQTDPGADNVFRQLGQFLAQCPLGSLVVLIDEYDAPLTACLDNKTLFLGIRAVMSQFYSLIKRYDGCFRFFFMTGITKWSSTSIFSEFNNLKDISLDSAYAALLGYTEEEVRSNFSGYLTQAATKLNLSTETVLKELKLNYNGFCFDEEARQRVFCPWSVLNFLDSPHQGFQNYWYVSRGHPIVLQKYLTKHQSGNPDRFDKPIPYAFDALATLGLYGKLPTELLLFQVGYLTIKQRLAASHVLLGYPNQEMYLAAQALGSIKQERKIC